MFAGFLSSKQGERRTVLEELKAIRTTLIFFEAPQRLTESLADMAEVLGNRPAVVTRELTKMHEEVRRGMLVDLAVQYAKEKEPRGELTVLVGPPKDIGVDFGRADPLLDQALKFMPVRAAAELVSEALGVPRRAIYDRALERKTEREDE